MNGNALIRNKESQLTEEEVERMVSQNAIPSK